MLNLVLALAGIFALIVVIGRLLHRYFVYLPDGTRVDPKEAGLQGVEEVVFKAADGTKLIAWYRPARDANPTLLYFTGNTVIIDPRVDVDVGYRQRVTEWNQI